MRISRNKFRTFFEIFISWPIPEASNHPWLLFGEQRQVLRNDVEAYILQLFSITKRPQFCHRKIKKPRQSYRYYANTCAAVRLLILGGDVELNPGPDQHREKTRKKHIVPRCLVCEQTVKSNNKRLICTVCFNQIHASCTGIGSFIKDTKCLIPCHWICHKCTLTQLPFYNERLPDFIVQGQGDAAEVGVDAPDISNVKESPCYKCTSL